MIKVDDNMKQMEDCSTKVINVVSLMFAYFANETLFCRTDGVYKLAMAREDSECTLQEKDDE